MVESSAVQGIPRQPKVERQWTGVQDSPRAIAWIQPAARLMHQPRQEWGSGGGGGGRGQVREPRGTFQPKLFNNIKWC